MGAGTYAKQGGENVSAEIIIAGLSLLGTLAGTAGGIIVSGKLVNYRIEQLEKKVEKHNNLPNLQAGAGSRAAGRACPRG